MRAKYTPSFLVSSKIPTELYAEVQKIAVEQSAAEKRTVTPEEVYRKAVKFYSARCVHTHSPVRRERKAARAKR